MLKEGHGGRSSMPIRRNPESGRKAVALLATAFVVLIGALMTAFTILASTEQAGWKGWLVWCLLFVGVVLMLWSLLDKPNKGPGILQLFIWRRAKVDPLTLYKPRKRRYQPEQPWGSNQPPNLETLRESANESSVTWVPHGNVPDRERKK